MSTSHDQAIFAKTISNAVHTKLSNAEAHAVDVLVIGAGFTGLTTAVKLVRAGKNVMVLEKDTIGSGESGFSTAQMTEFIDDRYVRLIEKFGQEAATQVAKSSRAAMNWVADAADKLQIDCGVEHLPAFLYSKDSSSQHEFELECQAMKYCGLSPVLGAPIHPAFGASAVIRLNDQIQLNPRQYLNGLAKFLTQHNCRIHEHTKVVEIDDGTLCRVKTEDGAIVVANDIVVATHSPICNIVFLHTKLASYRTYVMAVTLNDSPELPDGQYFDTQKPYHYMRPLLDDGRKLWLIGGEDHKTGTVDDTNANFARLESHIKSHFNLERVECQWSGQIIESIDGLPFIGKNSASKHLYVGTGYGGNGTTFGTLAGMIIADQILGLQNPWAELYHATRIKPVAGAINFISENADAAYHFFQDRLAKSDYEAATELPVEAGGILNIDGNKVAAYRSAGGYYFFSAVCPHLKCIVHWNKSEKSWDCPCHGARFECTGEVINGPAVSSLVAYDISKQLPEV